MFNAQFDRPVHKLHSAHARTRVPLCHQIKLWARLHKPDIPDVGLLGESSAVSLSHVEGDAYARTRSGGAMHLRVRIHAELFERWGEEFGNDIFDYAEDFVLGR